MTRRLVLLLYIALCAAACDRVRAARGPADLKRNLELAAELELVIHDSVKDAEPHLRRLAARLEPRFTVHFEPRGASVPRLIVARHGADASVDALANLAGVEPDDAGRMTWEGRPYGAPTDLVTLTLEDPERPGLPLTMILCNEPRVLEATLFGLGPPHRPTIRTLRRGDPGVEAELDLDGGLRASTLVDRAAAREELTRKFWARDAMEPGIRVSVGVPDSSSDHFPFTVAVLRAVDRVVEWFGVESFDPPLEITAFETLDELREVQGRADFSFVNRARGTASTILPRSDHPLEAGYAAAAAACWRIMESPPQVAWIEQGIAVDAAGAFHGRTLEAWAPRVLRIADDGLVQDLLEEDPQRSALLIAAGRGLFCRYFRSEFGQGALLRAMWDGEAPDGDWTAGFLVWLRENYGPPPQDREAGSSFEREWEVGLHMIESPRAPLGSEAFRRGLERLPPSNLLSLDAVIVRERGDDILFEPPCGFETEGGDAALSRAVSRIDKRVMLNLEFQATPSGSHVHELLMTTEEDWNLYFADRDRRIEHAGILADLAGVELLCLGSELIETTQTRGDSSAWDDPGLEGWKRAGWKRAIETARRSYSGPVGYSSRWPTETPQIEFWPALDFIGCTLYGAFLREDDSWAPPGDNQVRMATIKRLTDMCTLARELDRPLYVTELGLPSTEFGWRNPRIAEGEVDPEMQARVFAAMAKGVLEVAATCDNLNGVVFESWSSDPEAGGTGDRGWTLQGKPASQVLWDVRWPR